MESFNYGSINTFIVFMKIYILDLVMQMNKKKESK